MGKLSEKVVKHTAALAKITLSKTETKMLQTQMNDIVSYFDQLNEVDTEKTLPTSQTTGLENIYRDDATDTAQCLSQDEALSGTDKTPSGYIVVPMILENKDA